MAHLDRSAVISLQKSGELAFAFFGNFEVLAPETSFRHRQARKGKSWLPDHLPVPDAFSPGILDQQLQRLSPESCVTALDSHDRQRWNHAHFEAEEMLELALSVSSQ